MLQGRGASLLGEALDLVTQSSALVPSTWPLQIVDALVAGRRRGRLTEAQTARFLELLGKLPIDVVAIDLTITFGSVLAAARARGLSPYDATSSSRPPRASSRQSRRSARQGGR